MGFGVYDHAALKGRYLVLRKWRDGADRASRARRRNGHEPVRSPRSRRSSRGRCGARTRGRRAVRLVVTDVALGALHRVDVDAGTTTKFADTLGGANGSTPCADGGFLVTPERRPRLRGARDVREPAAGDAGALGDPSASRPTVPSRISRPSRCRRRTTSWSPTTAPSTSPIRRRTRLPTDTVGQRDGARARRHAPGRRRRALLPERDRHRGRRHRRDRRERATAGAR